MEECVAYWGDRVRLQKLSWTLPPCCHFGTWRPAKISISLCLCQVWLRSAGFVTVNMQMTRKPLKKIISSRKPNFVSMLINVDRPTIIRRFIFDIMLYNSIWTQWFLSENCIVRAIGIPRWCRRMTNYPRSSECCSWSCWNDLDLAVRKQK